MLKENFNLSIETQKEYLKSFHLEFFSKLRSRWSKDVTVLNKTKEYWFNFSKVYVSGPAFYKKMVQVNTIHEMHDCLTEVVNSEISEP